MSSSDSEDSDYSDEVVENAMIEYYVRAKKRRQQMVTLATIIGISDHKLYMNRSEYRVPLESGYQWVTRTLGNRRQCFNMFRMNRDCFDKLHNLLVGSYELKSTP